jgi:hypothetical protein
MNNLDCRRTRIQTLQCFLAAALDPIIDFKGCANSPVFHQRRELNLASSAPGFLRTSEKTCATYYDEHVPKSSVEILGHSAGGVTYRHYAHRAPLAFRAILTLPQPAAFKALAKGFDGQCPCCRRRFTEANDRTSE